MYEKIGDEAILVISKGIMHFTAMKFSGTNIRIVKVYRSRPKFAQYFLPPSLSNLHRRRDVSHVHLAKPDCDILVELCVQKTIGIELGCHKLLSCFGIQFLADVLRINNVSGLLRGIYFLMLELHLVLLPTCTIPGCIRLHLSSV